MPAELSVVVPSYNGRELLRGTLSRLLAVAPEAEVIVPDGGSSDGSPEMVRAEFPAARLLDIENLGFAHATNRGLEAAGGRLLLMLNSDLLVTRAALDAMTAALGDPAVGAAGPVLLNPDGSRQWGFGPLYWPNWSRLERPVGINLLHGACLMTRRDVLERVGGLDENFFFYNEEFDWCWRLGRAGLRMRLLPERVVHVEGGSTPDRPDFLFEAQRGALYLIDKHFPGLPSLAFRKAVELEGWVFSSLDPRPTRRDMWARLGDLARRGALLESPFPLSGRGEWRPAAGGTAASDPRS